MRKKDNLLRHRIRDEDHGIRGLLSSYVDLGPDIVPLLVGHIADWQWRQIAKSEKSVVIDGHHYSGLCDACDLCLGCSVSRIRTTRSICQASVKTLEFLRR